MGGAEVLRFDDFELDRRAYQLRRHGKVVHLERIPLDLLFLLVERQGNLVTRQEISERLWGKGIFVDINASINGAVRKIRRALQDNAEEPRFIAAIPAKGYRFIASVREASIVGSELRRPQTTFVGRNREIATLSARLPSSSSGRGGLFLISGQPGIGKTWLARELGIIAQARGMQALEGRCVEYGDPIPYLPFVEILEGYVERAAEADHLRLMLGDEGSELARLLPKIKLMLPDLPEPLELPPPQARRHLFSCFGDFVARQAKEHPTLLILEDLHWADDSSLALLVHLAPRLAKLRIVVLATYRDTELEVSPALAKTLEVLLRSRLATVIRLVGLNFDEIAEMVRGLSGREPPASVVKEIYQETEGNPFFAEELFRYLEEEHRLYDTDGVFRPDFKIAEVGVPRSVQLVVGQRLTRLNERCRMTLGSAAVIGPLFTLELLAAVTRADPDSLLESIEEAEQAGFVLSCTEKSKASVEFTHELVRQAVIRRLSGVRQEQLHLEVARAIERLYSEHLEDHLGELAHHYRRGNNAPKALDYARMAAEQALHRAAYTEATSLVEAALKLAEKLPEVNQRLRAELVLRRIESVVAFALYGGSSSERERLIRLICELSERIGDADILLRGLITLSGLYFSRGEAAHGFELAERCFKYTDATQDQALLAGVHFTAGILAYSCGKLREAVSRLENATTHAGRTNRIVSLADGLYSSCIPCFQAPSLHLLGRISQSLAFAEEGLRHVRESGHQFTLGVALLLRARISRYRREPQVVLALSEETIALSEHSGIAAWLNQGRFNRGWALTEMGQLKEGISDMEWAIARAQRMGGAPWLQYLIASMAQAYAKVGETKKGLATLNESLAYIERTGEKIDHAEMLRLKGELLLMHDSGATEEAEFCFRAALEAAKAQEAKWWELRSTTSLARLQRNTSRSDEASIMLSAIYNWFTEGFDTADLKEAKTLIAELSR